VSAVENFADAIDQDRAFTRSNEPLLTSGPAITAHLLSTTRNDGPHVLAALRAYRDQHEAECGCQGCELYETESDA
jgi:hypothetical protein